MFVRESRGERYKENLISHDNYCQKYFLKRFMMFVYLSCDFVQRTTISKPQKQMQVWQSPIFFQDLLPITQARGRGRRGKEGGKEGRVPSPSSSCACGCCNFWLGAKFEFKLLICIISRRKQTFFFSCGLCLSYMQSYLKVCALRHYCLVDDLPLNLDAALKVQALHFTMIIYYTHTTHTKKSNKYILIRNCVHCKD